MGINDSPHPGAYPGILQMATTGQTGHISHRHMTEDPAPRASQFLEPPRPWWEKIPELPAMGTQPAASIQAPSIYPLRLCCTEEARVRLGCLVKDYLPGSVTVTWDTVPLDGSTLTFPSIQMASSSLYITTSQLTISGEQPKEFTCRVLHAETNSNLNKTISTECAKNFSDPSVKLFYSSCNPNGDTQTTIHLLCRISGYTPGKIKVTWLVDGLKSEELYARSGPEIQEGNLTSTYSEVNITQGQWVSEKTYTCRVNYYGYNFESHAHRCTAESEPRGVSAYLSPPTPLELYVNKSPKITCLVVDLANEKNLSLTWSRANGKPVHAGPPEIKRQFNGTVTVTSTLPVDVTDWVEGETYYCKVSHSDLPTDIQRSISKDVGKRLAPKAYVFLPDGKELENEEELTLTCMIQKFFPRDIFVRWLHNKELMRADQHTTTQPHRADNNTPAFFAYSRLAVPRANWKRGDEFTCQVIHEALPRTRTLEKSVFINSGK
uniref:Ig-like domain-containing protein n=1 Tax=Bos indicus x Bos taurus TaxID=30522 RepID=A0A4W2EA23_BOBOX